ncbi:tetratricopeptide repeat protein, partial [Candidatus Microgenomates bacterium]|nr:tetratricopeptide repeat protein [Candidatus Microgenomates bacterium]
MGFLDKVKGDLIHSLKDKLNEANEAIKSEFGGKDNPSCIDKPQIRIKIGEDEHSKGNYNKDKLVDLAVKLEPQDEDFGFQKGMSLIHHEKYDEAVECFDKALALRPDNVAVWASKCIALNSLNKFDEAVGCANSAIMKHPNNALIWYVKGNSLLNLERNGEAIECYDVALKLDPPNSEIANIRAKREIAVEHHNPKNYINLGVKMFQEGNYNKAIEYFDETLKFDNTNLFCWKVKGDAFNKLNKF